MKYIILLLSLLLLSSCASIVINSEFKRMGFYEENSKVEYLTNGTKEVAFIGMHHIGRKEFYDDVAAQIDSLKKQNYVVFYEGYDDGVGIDSLAIDRNTRKFRKLTGIKSQDYLDTVNNTFLNYKLSSKYKLMNQPGAYKMNIDTTKALRADISMNTMIHEYEKRYSEIKLDSCDLKIPLESNSYDCETLEKSNTENFIDVIALDLRNKNLAKEIQNHQSNKILVVFGKLHLPGMKIALGKLDSNWQYASDKNNMTN